MGKYIIFSNGAHNSKYVYFPVFAYTYTSYILPIDNEQNMYIVYVYTIHVLMKSGALYYTPWSEIMMSS